MSYEHRALGYRPPPGSIAAEAQAAAAKHAASDTSVSNTALSNDILREVANRDAEKIKWVFFICETD